LISYAVLYQLISLIPVVTVFDPDDVAVERLAARLAAWTRPRYGDRTWSSCSWW